MVLVESAAYGKEYAEAHVNMTFKIVYNNII